MSKRSKGKKVAIVGFSKTSYDDVPWDNPGWEKWGLAWDLNGWERYTRLFDMHHSILWEVMTANPLYEHYNGEEIERRIYRHKDYYDKGHYDFHRDIGTGDEIMKARVNVGILQLSSPSEYKGGVLQIKYQDQVIDVMKTKGMVTTFPIQLEHRVTPVTSGVRKTLIMWGLV